MNNITKALALLLSGFSAIIGVMILAIIIGPLFGGLAAWVVSWFFDDAIQSVLHALKIYNVSTVQLGIFLGFFSAFFKTGAKTSNA